MAAQEVLIPANDPNWKQADALAPLTPLSLLQVALQKEAAIDVIERLVAMQREEREYQARVSFDEALSRCQAKLGRISADAQNKQTNSMYATYAKLDKVVRPIYTGEGFSISYGEKDCPNPTKTRFVAYVSRGGITREYIKDMTPSTKGPQGKEFMTPIHADATADSYAKRYLLKDIFNIAIGEEDTDGNSEDAAPVRTLDDLYERLEWIGNCKDLVELQRIYADGYKAAKAIGDERAMILLSKAKDEKKREFLK